MIKKALLIHPEISRTKYNFAGVIDNEPLELEYISAMLKSSGITCEIWDGQVEKIPAAEKIKDFRPELLYVCGRTRQEGFMKEYCRAAKSICGSVVIVGGIHAQHCFERFYISEVDYILRTFDIFKILDIINGVTPESISGLCYKCGDKWLSNEADPFDISRLPIPDRKYFYSHSDRYRYLELLPCAHVRTSYSCPFRCTFCYRNRLNCGEYTVRPIRDVVMEIRNIKCDNIYIIDDDFLIDKRRVEEFIRLVRKYGIKKKYVCYGRADFIAANQPLMAELKKIGFYYILTGLEASDESYLESYRKKTTVDCNETAVRTLNRVGINIMGMFIADLDFSPSDFTKLYSWIRRNKLSHVAVSILTPELNSSMFDKYRDRIISDDPAEWDYLHVVAKPKKMSVKEYYFHYHILMIRLFVKGWRDGIYDFLDYGSYIRSFLKNMFRFGG
ncbi:MAG: radical SAM protein [Ruminococcus sp.]|nr:radical SAM protein [Ruminococcus sp.]